MVGNSSSGIIEMPFNKPTINLGKRQIWKGNAKISYKF